MWIGLLDENFVELDKPDYRRQRMVGLGHPVVFGPTMSDWGIVAWAALYEQREGGPYREYMDITDGNAVSVPAGCCLQTIIRRHVVNPWDRVAVPPNAIPAILGFSPVLDPPTPTTQEGDEPPDQGGDYDDDDEDDYEDDDDWDDDDDTPEDIAEPPAPPSPWRTVDPAEFDWETGRYRRSSK